MVTFTKQHLPTTKALLITIVACILLTLFARTPPARFRLAQLSIQHSRRAASAMTQRQRFRYIRRLCGHLCEPLYNRYHDAPNQAVRRIPLTSAWCNNAFAHMPVLFARSSPNTRSQGRLSEHRTIPSWLLAHYTMHGRVAVLHASRKSPKPQWRIPARTRELLHLLRSVGVRRRSGAVRGKRKRVLVLGSHTPWVKVAALAAGASSQDVVTVEFGCDVRGDVYSANEFAILYRAGRMSAFDVVIAYASVEQLGLGRHGEALNPSSDIISLALMWCVTKKGGTLVLQVPRFEHDALDWNVGRIYGSLRLPILTTNWIRKLVPSDINLREPSSSVNDTYGSLSSPFVLTRVE